MRARCLDGVMIASFSFIWLGHGFKCCTEIAWRFWTSWTIFFFFSLWLRLFLLFDPPRRESGWAQISSQLPSENTRCTFLYICYLFLKLFCFIHSSMYAGILILSKTCFEICLSQHLVFTHFRDNQQHICKHPILPLTFSYQKCSGLPNLGSDSKQYM